MLRVITVDAFATVRVCLVPCIAVAAHIAALTNHPLLGEHGWMDRHSRWFDEGASALRLVLERQGRDDQLRPPA